MSTEIVVIIQNQDARIRMLSRRNTPQRAGQTATHDDDVISIIGLFRLAPVRTPFARQRVRYFVGTRVIAAQARQCGRIVISGPDVQRRVRFRQRQARAQAPAANKPMPCNRSRRLMGRSMPSSRSEDFIPESFARSDGQSGSHTIARVPNCGLVTLSRAVISKVGFDHCKTQRVFAFPPAGRQLRRRHGQSFPTDTIFRQIKHRADDTDTADSENPPEQVTVGRAGSARPATPSARRCESRRCLRPGRLRAPDPGKPASSRCPRYACSIEPSAVGVPAQDRRVSGRRPP